IDVSDRRFIELETRTERSSRTLYVRDTAGAPTAVEFLPPLEGVTFTADGAQWSGSLPGAAELAAYSFERFAMIRARASEGWVAAHGELAIDTEIPGFLPA